MRTAACETAVAYQAGLRVPLGQPPERGSREVERLLLELHHAADMGQFSLAYQPKVDLCCGSYAGSEVLLRWNSPVLGHVTPAEFIPIAEDSGLIKTIGKWIINESIRDLSRNRSRVANSRRLAINVSAAQLASETFVPWLERLLDDQGVPGSSVELEVTESALMSNIPMCARHLSQARLLGTSITLDDFGTGYSTFSHLRKLPIDTIKIAPEFIADITVDPASGRLVAAMVSMARALDLEVVAEGIETQTQASFLADTGCHYGQGYLFARPMTGHALDDWLKAQSARLCSGKGMP